MHADLVLPYLNPCWQRRALVLESISWAHFNQRNGLRPSFRCALHASTSSLRVCSTMWGDTKPKATTWDHALAENEGPRAGSSPCARRRAARPAPAKGPPSWPEPTFWGSAVVYERCPRFSLSLSFPRGCVMQQGFLPALSLRVV